MTIDEVSSRYNIPLNILHEYERREYDAAKKTEDVRQYDDNDIEKLSMIMTLLDAGFNGDETESYMRMELSGENTSAQRLEMLNKRRNTALDEIHRKEDQLDRLDYLRHKVRTEK